MSGIGSDDAAQRYAAGLLTDLKLAADLPVAGRAEHPFASWARSGAMHLTGFPDGPPSVVEPPLACAARGSLRALAAVAYSDALACVDGARLLGERAALLGLERRGRISAGGGSRLLRAADGWIAASLARPEDRDFLPAWLGEGDTGDPWAFVAERIEQRPAHEVVERARLLGLPVAPAPPHTESAPWFRASLTKDSVALDPVRVPRVIDLSSLWAGPLCTNLLQQAGARVVKVESTTRPDGARRGPASFFDLLNADKESVAFDFASQADRRRLRALLAGADIVVESSRPRALAQLGIEARALVEEHPGLVWVSLTGYGREEPCSNWVAFGDDAAAAAGLAFAAQPTSAAPCFCADAIADPLAGMHAALAAFSVWRTGRGAILDLSLRDVACHAAGQGSAEEIPQPRRRTNGDGDWEIDVAGEDVVVGMPQARQSTGAARPLGADTEAVLHELVPGC